jgi:transcriptional regulator with XRE-family HTH domain
MEDPGQRLKRAREDLNLRFRDVEQASRVIAERRKSAEYVLYIGRLSEIENHSVVPSIYRIYSLCAIYRLDYFEVLNWYGINLPELPGESLAIPLAATHPIQFEVPGSAEITAPLSLDPGVDPRKTAFLSRIVSKWGKLPLSIFNSLDVKKYRYGFIGSEDWSMFPLIQPGALVVIDDSRRKIVNSGWSTEFERPVYFLEHRNGFACCWCTLNDAQLVLQPHPASLCPPQVFRYPQDIDVIGQVSGVAMILDPERRRRTRS